LSWDEKSLGKFKQKLEKKCQNFFSFLLALKSFPSFPPTSLEDVIDKNGKWAGKSDSIPDTAPGLGIEWLGLDTGLYYITFLQWQSALKHSILVCACNNEHLS
jgi:hypothetical protein